MKKTTYHQLDATNARMLMGAGVFDGPVDPSQLRSFVEQPDSILFFAVSGGMVAGFASGTVLLHPDKTPVLFVNEVGVDEPFRRQGIATELTKRLLKAARKRGCRGCWVATEKDNDAARGLYRHLDGRETEGVVVYDWGDVVP